MKVSVFAMAVLVLAGCAATPTKPPQSATIYRDTWGVPHIYSASEEAGFHALGYAQAQDRLPQLLASPLWVQGRLAEIMGDAALAGDIESRRWRTWEEGAKGFERLSPELQRNYRAFTAGVKKYIVENPKLVPAWAPEFTPQVMTAVTRAMYWTGYNAVWGPGECAKEGVKRQMSGSLDTPEKRATRDERKDPFVASSAFRDERKDPFVASSAFRDERKDPFVASSALVARIEPPARGFPDAVNASNEWAIFPPRTADGETMLLADPHVDVNNPSYYEYRMHAGDLHSAGFAAGALLWQSQNRHVAWAFTTGHPDMWDCYAVETSPDNPREYLFDGKPQAMEIRKETFKSASGKVVEQEFEYTRHNGVLSAVVRREGNVAYVVSQSQMHDGGLMDEEIYRMNRAGSVKQLREALKTLGMMPQNLMAIDAGGHGYYLHAGKTPVRPKGYDFTKPVPGNTSATAWQGIHPLDAMIEVTDPAAGYMTNNNVSPDQIVAGGNIDPAKYPPEVFYDTPGRITTRGVRTLEVLGGAKKFSIDDAKALVFDEKWVTTKLWQDALSCAASKHPKRLAPKSDGAKLVARILGFDGVASADSSAALNFWFWREEAGRLLEKPEFASMKKLPWAQCGLPVHFRRAILDAANTAAQAQIKAVGSLDAPLGQYFRSGRGGKTHPLGGASILPIADEACLWQVSPQCDRTLRAFGFDAANKAGEKVAARGSQAVRLVVFGKNPQTWTLYAFGQQSSPGPHFDDQAELFSRKQMKPALFEKEELMPRVKSTTTLEMQ